MPGKDAIKAFRAKGQAKKAAKRRAKTDLPHGSYSKIEMHRGKEIIPKKSNPTREAFLAEHQGAGSLAGFYMAKKSKREHKKFSPIGLGRTKEGRTPRSPKVPFERGRIGLKPIRKKTRKSSRDSARKSGR